MSFYRKIQYYLVHTLKLSNKEALSAIKNGLVKINDEIISNNIIIDDTSEIKLNNKIIRAKIKFVYLKFHKPIGYESTLSNKVEKNLSTIFKDYTGLSIAGRLDKESEGLLILSNDGKWVEQLINPKFIKEKEYLVELDKPVTPDFVTSFELGVDIGFYITKPCKCIIKSKYVINVILTEGKNRQLRRMCLKLGYKVIKLKRVRIAQYSLDNLKEGLIESFEK